MIRPAMVTGSVVGVALAWSSLFASASSGAASGHRATASAIEINPSTRWPQGSMPSSAIASRFCSRAVSKRSGLAAFLSAFLSAFFDFGDDVASDVAAAVGSSGVGIAG